MFNNGLIGLNGFLLLGMFNNGLKLINRIFTHPSNPFNPFNPLFKNYQQ